MSAAGPRAFFNIARDWSLSAEEQIVLLGSPGRSTYFKWKNAPQSARLARDTLERFSLILGIYKALQILLPDPKAADTWIRRPNAAPSFGGRPALERIRRAISAISSPYASTSTRCEAAGRDGDGIQ
ncbi:hypothetical protein BPUN_3414 [Candidatus Paraburkholderia kirkii]|nr:hypothetical protein BPUN_3414 [Candidatus Paraburkholderia kirkii]